MIAAFLQFVLLAVIVLLIIGGLTIFSLFRSFRDIAERAKDFFQGNSQTYNGGNKRDNTYGDEVIIDKRTSDKAKRKIFADNEGEYVDFEEEK